MQVSHKKLRFLITLHVLYKYTDANHRLNSKKLNEFLKPYGVESGYRSLKDTIEVLWKYGVGVKTHGTLNKHGVWLEERPLTDAALKQLIFAVTTNPYLAADQQADLLESLNPLVTVYQEPLLQNNVQLTQNSASLSAKQIEAYSVIHEAICTNKRVRIAKKKISRTKGEQIQYSSFTPKGFHVIEDEIYIVGYNHQKEEIETVPLAAIENVEFAKRKKNSHEDMAKMLVNDASDQQISQLHIYSE